MPDNNDINRYIQTSVPATAEPTWSWSRASVSGGGTESTGQTEAPTPEYGVTTAGYFTSEPSTIPWHMPVTASIVNPEIEKLQAEVIALKEAIHALINRIDGTGLY